MLKRGAGEGGWFGEGVEFRELILNRQCDASPLRPRMFFGQAAQLWSPVPSMKDPGPNAGSGEVPVARPSSLLST